MRAFYRAIVFAMAVMCIVPAYGQDGGGEEEKPKPKPIPEDTVIWETGGTAGLTFTQIGLFNWAGGGTSSMTLIASTNLHADRKGPKSTWENDLAMAYGFVKPNFIYDPAAPLQKAEDKIDLSSKYGYKAWSDQFKYTMLFGARSQFVEGFANPGDSLYISRFLSPAYLQLSLGLDYKPTKELSFYLSPASMKMTVVADTFLANKGEFGVNRFEPTGEPVVGSGEWYLLEFGATFKAKYKVKVKEKGKFETTLELFSNYLDNPEGIDVRWTTQLILPVTNVITVNFSSDMIYDDEVRVPLFDKNGDPLLNPVTGEQLRGLRVQFKEVFGVGLQVKLGK